MPPTDDDEVRDAVFGNKRIGLPGLVVQQKQTDDKIKRVWTRIEKESRRLDRMVYIAVGAGFGGAFGGGWIVALLRGSS